MRGGFRTVFVVDLEGIAADIFDVKSGRGATMLTSIAKLCLHEELVKHHQKRIPKHFKQQARQEYGYKQRTDATRRRKRKLYGSTRDLVKTGATEQLVTRARQISVGGTLKDGGGSILGTLSMWFPYSIRRDPQNPGGVTINDMAGEISRVSAAEALEIEQGFTDRFVLKLNEYRHGRRRFNRPKL